MSITVTFLGHATFDIDANGERIVIDPFLAGHNPSCTRSVDDVADGLDFIAVTHGHHDHVSDLEALAKASQALVIANYEICHWLNGKGVDHTHPMHIGGSHLFSFGRLKLTIAPHGSLLPDGSCGGAAAGLLFEFRNGKVLYHAGDTGLTYDMRLIGGAHRVNLALLPIGDNFTMGPQDAAVAAQYVNAEKVVPIHYNTMPVIEQDPEMFASLLEAEGIACEIMQAGDQCEL